jgi:hypothetical protein
MEEINLVIGANKGMSSRVEVVADIDQNTVIYHTIAR